MPFGHRRVEVGLMLRDAMFVNGVLCNSEARHSITEKNIEDLQVMDRSLLRHITKAHAKVQTEFIYLETGAIPIKQMMMNRRMMYQQNILKRSPDELLRQVYEAQKENPVRGDWIKMINNDFETLEIDMNENEIQLKSKCEYKSQVKHIIKEHVFKKLKIQQANHSKIRDICYNSFKGQEYLRSHMLNNHEVSLLFSLRSRTAREFKANFPYFKEQTCPMGCLDMDTQEHILICPKLNSQKSQDITAQYSDLFSSDINQQTVIIKVFTSLLERREDACASEPAGPDHTMPTSVV